MDYLKVRCFHCKGEFELYNRNMNYDDKPPRCPHCLKKMDKTQWERLIIPSRRSIRISENTMRTGESRCFRWSFGVTL